MKISLKTAVIASALLMVSCSPKTSAPEGFEGEKTSIHSVPVIDDVNTLVANNPYDYESIYFEMLSDSVDYLVIPEDFHRNATVDSLVAFFNIAAAANALQADFNARLRMPEINLESFDVSGITDNDAKPILEKLYAAVVSPLDLESQQSVDRYYDEIDKCYTELNDFLEERYISRFGYLDFESDSDPTIYVADFDKIKEKVYSDENHTAELRKLCEEETYFIPQTFLATQYALSCYKNYRNGDDTNNMEGAIALIQQLLDSGKYSPLLPTLWRMWRCWIQVHLFSPSNDGEIQNHFYNGMRNKVALTSLREFIDNPTADSFYTFFETAVRYNIIRKGTYIGNYATREEMDLFYSPTKE